MSGVSARTLRSMSCINRLGRLVVERARKPHAGTVDEHVGIGPLRRQRRLDSGDGIRRGDVGGDGDGLDLELGADALAAAFERLGPPGDQHQVVAGGCEPAGQRLADALRAAGDHHHRPQARVGRQRLGVSPPPAPPPELHDAGHYLPPFRFPQWAVPTLLMASFSMP